jgi:hypothetical protein
LIQLKNSRNNRSFLVRDSMAITFKLYRILISHFVPRPNLAALLRAIAFTRPFLLAAFQSSKKTSQWTIVAGIPFDCWNNTTLLLYLWNRLTTSWVTSLLTSLEWTCKKRSREGQLLLTGTPTSGIIWPANSPGS